MKLRLAVPLPFVLALSGIAYADLTPRGITGSDWSQTALRGDGWPARNRGQQWLTPV